MILFDYRIGALTLCKVGHLSFNPKVFRELFAVADLALIDWGSA
jgi:hypothetical protein